MNYNYVLDIATPVFKHTIDFMNKDYEKQESTEELTTTDSKVINMTAEVTNVPEGATVLIEHVPY